MPAFAPGSLLAYLAEVPDPRSRLGRQHPVPAILGLVCCALLCGASGYAAIAQFAHDHDLALMHRLGFTRRPPKGHGLRKVLLRLDAAAFEAALTRWAEAVLGRPLRAADTAPGAPAAPAAGPLRAAALDGKALRATTALAGYLDWPDVAQIGRVKAEVTRDGKTTREVRYFLTSVPRAWADAGQLRRWVRGH